MQKKKQGKRTWGVFIVALAVTVAILLLCAALETSAKDLTLKVEDMRALARLHRGRARLIYAGAVIFQVLVAVIPGEPLEILGGYMFGAVEGTLLCLGSATLGSVLVFLLVRQFGAGLVSLFFSREKLRKLYFLQHAPRRLFLFALIFMIPGTPKDLLCYYAGLTDIKLLPFLLICSFGRFPAIVTSTLGGDAMGVKCYLSAFGIFALTMLISGLGLLLYERICGRQASSGEGKPDMRIVDEKIIKS